MEAGCHLVPRTTRKLGEKRSKTWFKTFMLSHDPPVWRISFSVSEKILTTDFSMAQRKCYLLLKVLFTHISWSINSKLEKEKGEDNFIGFKISGFLLKHVMFWTMERISLHTWRIHNLPDSCC